MPWKYTELPPLWFLQELFHLSNDCPSGLIWAKDFSCHTKGKPAGRINIRTGKYFLFIENQHYLAHRIVFYLRTGICPDGHDVVHVSQGGIKDNRGELVLCNNRNYKHLKLLKAS